MGRSSLPQEATSKAQQPLSLVNKT
ncbi:uncharacterized protein G2W53_044347 [Senna tora]|uniref:Uncharacterized protein n=1 Tax=Senna tora TaxID=362788 RepID=A0A834W4B1_9FABA|nr:uncharacterized protein G2W53_044347 [Senna tora]